jgi:DNA-binding transcriptional ArsR family regulator
MEHAPCISQIATLLADPKRSAMMWALMDGSARQTEELALLAGLSPSSASAHLGRLSAGGLLKVELRGRKRFFRLAAPEIGAAIEALASATIASTPQNVPDIFKRTAPWPNRCRPVRHCCVPGFAMIIWAAHWPLTCISGYWIQAGSNSSISVSR